ncbi:helix-turn-helix domain-containing protein [Belnapia sp. T6]|uniref:Helix-turn-helix domain-containing protein n=1 Tax=Belnapia mucosa TaxID=2804532 RepID=A0ABS1V6H0_9PROT|nr:helix-turn-helix domain-containing protein [Belnapia mucosa]MBL6457271.1 helix-turn-helix domain-containing protein [Belnapia mucosa]
MMRSIRPEPAAEEAARLGEELRDARAALGLSVEDVAASLRIRPPYLLALEEGRVRDLPAPAYAVGFVRSYARALGLPEDEVVRRFREASGPVVQRKTDLVFPEPVPERGVPAGAVILVGALLTVGAYIGWYQWSGSGNRVVDSVPPVPPRLEQAARPEPASSPAVQAALPPPVQPPAAGAASVPPVPVPAAATPPPARPAEEGRVVLRARAETWVQLRDRNANSVIFNRVLRPGETYAVPGREGLLLSTGNAGGLEILVDGQPAPGLGGAQAVRRDVPVEPDRLKSGLPPQPAPAPRPTP